MKVLILHQHFNTPEKGGALRSYYLATALAAKGIEVTVITAHNEKIYRQETIENIDVHYLPVAYDNRFGFFARSRSFLKYVRQSVNLARRFRNTDYCYAISVPLTVGLVAMWIKLRYKIPYIFEVGDLWPEAPIQLGFINNFVFAQSLYALEKRIYKSAHAVVALSPSIKSAIEKKVPGKPVHLIPNMADCDFYKPEKKDAALEHQYGVHGKLVVSYIGAIGVANGLDSFLECVNASRKAQLPVHFFMCGDGAELERLKGHAQSMGLTNLTFLDFRNRDGVKELLNITDATFISFKQVPVLETGSPNKLFDGLAAGKLIIINFGGWLKQEIESTQCGFYYNPQQPTEFIKKLSAHLYEGGLLERAQAASRKLGEEKYNRKILSDSFTLIFNKLK
ncbi:MAG: glycosyltransferase family 4 protein [Cyclobacteriaceae bacterium]|nr:glycosyltransferase family 4 protein [Cyclobacteriaceae bacterium]